MKNVVVGVILGALLTFSAQFYSDYRDQRHSSRVARAQHLERAMLLTSKFRRTDMSFLESMDPLIRRLKEGGVPTFFPIHADYETPDELKMIAELYIPEIRQEVTDLTNSYAAFVSSASNAVLDAFEANRDENPFKAVTNDENANQMRRCSDDLRQKLAQLAHEHGPVEGAKR